MSRERLTGTKAVAERMVHAEERFLDSVVEQFGFTRDEALRIMAAYKRHKVLKIDPVMGQYSLADGRFWDREVMLRALGASAGRSNPMRDYEEVPERMRVTGTNPACKVAPTAKQFQGYEGMSVQLCPASKPWPKDFKFDGAQDVMEFAKTVGMVDDVRERLYAIYCDNKNVPLGYRLIGSGGVTETLVDPKILFQPAAALSAPVIFMVHNHPSGSLTASPTDDALTQRLKKAAEYLGFRVVDHVIVSTQGYFSYVDNLKL